VSCESYEDDSQEWVGKLAEDMGRFPPEDLITGVAFRISFICV
jgi:hypothetical protein